MNKLLLLVLILLVVLVAGCTQQTQKPTENTTESVNRIVGVKVGDWVNYSVYQTGMNGTEISNPEIFDKIEITEISGMNVTEIGTTYYKNGDIVTSMPWKMDISKEILIENVILANLNIGDPLFYGPDGKVSHNVNQITTRNYNGVNREVIYDKDSVNQLWYDRKTGFLLEWDSKDDFGVIKNLKLNSTNLW